ncbi:Highly acidic protein [hydrothermal vent metagenome]|uniref:Highly acidic protein n=1 Tax=hydrothermal vent metagenome TaxID=652676 RepID=A0A1W1EAI3_9ZZZZ
MKILLINTNPVVSRLVSMCVNEPFVVFEEIAQVSQAREDRYDIVFVDDDAYNDEVSAFLGWVAKAGKVVYFSGAESREEISTVVDTVIQKPFLPSHVQHIIESVNAKQPKEKVLSANEEEQPAVKEESHSIFPLSAAQESIVSESEEKEDDDKSGVQGEKSEEDGEGATEPKVLDSREIEQIKVLLEEEEESIPLIDPENEVVYEARKVEVITQKLEENGLEIVPEEEIVAVLSKPDKKVKKKMKKKMKKKRAKKSAEEVYTFEEALLAAVENMKPKKIKKLLKDAEVTISIRFKDKK